MHVNDNFYLFYCMSNTHKAHISTAPDLDIPLVLFYANNYKDNRSLAIQNIKYVCMYHIIFCFSVFDFPTGNKSKFFLIQTFSPRLSPAHVLQLMIYSHNFRYQKAQHFSFINVSVFFPCIKRNHNFTLT